MVTNLREENNEHKLRKADEYFRKAADAKEHRDYPKYLLMRELGQQWLNSMK